MQISLSPEAEALVAVKVHESGGAQSADDIVNDAVLAMTPLTAAEWERLDALCDEAERSVAAHGARDVDAAFVASLRARIDAADTSQD